MVAIVVTASALINMLIPIIVIALIFWLLWWLIGYIKLPEPFNKVVRVIIAIVAVIILINCILGFAGDPFIRW